MRTVLTCAGARIEQVGGRSELVVDLCGGQIRGGADGTWVSLVDDCGSTLHDGSAYWDVQEWVDDPELVMGAFLGGARMLFG